MNMHFINVLSSFNIEWDTQEEANKEDDPYVPVINNKENDCKVIKQVSIFTDCLSQNDGSIGPLVYVLQESSAVPSEVDDPLDTDSYHVEGGNLYDKMVARLSYNGPK